MSERDEEFEKGIRPKNKANAEALAQIILKIFEQWHREGYRFQDGRAASRLAGQLADAGVLVPSALSEEQVRDLIFALDGYAEDPRVEEGRLRPDHYSVYDVRDEPEEP